MSPTEHRVEIEVATAYIEEQSDPEASRFVFAYHITIRNAGEAAVQLLNRHWIIRDARDQTQEVRGEGVVGKQPRIPPGEEFEYTSGTVLETPVGTMEGSYQMRDDSGFTFEAPIPPFTLSVPHSLH
ncbi:Co2+/Mg2+ efflux protein ApaG [Thioalkalivibrio paradoxus]|uniref:Protein ApaG n=1 Tax=Thioalkalivibrio paradoxus ARh 1 TaxID=713585 RepID=W0DH12_9GAMM|nr:Co2+/Mg2+ efflux protein ApaG [Thioalkalivibrio paradoxus]AHE97924.1 magnesium transporter ApaG [Thioalkalivibrio paradoxus ARh 1]